MPSPSPRQRNPLRRDASFILSFFSLLLLLHSKQLEFDSQTNIFKSFNSCRLNNKNNKNKTKVEELEVAVEATS